MRLIWLKVFQPMCAEQPLAVLTTLVVSGQRLHQLPLVSWHRAVRLPYFIVMGAAYFVAGVLPGLFIKDRQYDPQKQS